MTDDIRRPTSQDVHLGDEERLEQLPDFETDADRTSGGGIMEEGGTTIDRGTGQLGGSTRSPGSAGEAEGRFPSLVDFGETDEDDENELPPSVGTETD